MSEDEWRTSPHMSRRTKKRARYLVGDGDSSTLPTGLKVVVPPRGNPLSQSENPLMKSENPLTDESLSGNPLIESENPLVDASLSGNPLVDQPMPLVDGQETSLQAADYIMVSTPNLPTGYFLLTEAEIEALQSRRRERFGGSYHKISTPNLPTGHFLLSDSEVMEIQSITRDRR